MKHALVLVLAFAAACDAPADGPLEMTRPDPPRPQDPQVWLAQLVGEWTVSTEIPMGPDQEPAQMRSTESARLFGESWLVAEIDADRDGTAFRSVMTVGYDARKEEFVGTWIDTMQPLDLWVYRGWLDPRVASSRSRRRARRSTTPRSPRSTATRSSS